MLQDGGVTAVPRTPQAKIVDNLVSHTATLHGVPSLAPGVATAQTICKTSNAADVDDQKPFLFQIISKYLNEL